MNGAHGLRRAVVVVALLPIQLASQEPARDSARTAADTVSYHPETVSDFLYGAIGPRPLVRALALSGFDQWRDRPKTFPRNGRGFGDRLGSRLGQVAISHTLRFGAARAFEQRTMRYHLCSCTGAGGRALYAIEAPLRVITPNGLRLSPLNPITELVSGVMVTATHPGGFSVGQGLFSGATSIAAESAFAMVREFWPWHWRPPFF